MKKYICNRCQKTFTKKSNYDYHIYKKKIPCEISSKMIKKSDSQFRCPKCNKLFTRRDNLTRHINSFCWSKICEGIFSPSGLKSQNDNTFNNLDYQDNSNIINFGSQKGSDHFSDPHKTLKVILTYEKSQKKVQEPTTIIKLSSDQLEYCQYCNIIFDSKSDKDKHLEITHSQKSMSRKQNKYICNYCSKEYTAKTNLYRHLRNNCIIKKRIDCEKEEIYQRLMKEMNEQKQLVQQMRTEVNNIKNNKQNKNDCASIVGSNNMTCNMNSNNSNNNNNNNFNHTNNFQNNMTINVNPFGKENIKVTERYQRLLFSKGFNSVPKLINHIHFNKNNPENHNIYISNIRSNYVAMFDGNEWKLMDRDEALEKLYDDKTYYLEEQFYQQYDNLKPVVRKTFEKFLENYDDDKAKNIVMNNIKLILYNGRRMIMTTHDIHKKLK